MSVRLTHTWVITVRLTHSYMYAGYRLGGSLAYITTVGSDTETSLYVHAVGFSTGLVRDLGLG